MDKYSILNLEILKPFKPSMLDGGLEEILLLNHLEEGSTFNTKHPLEAKGYHHKTWAK